MRRSNRSLRVETYGNVAGIWAYLCFSGPHKAGAAPAYA